MPLPRSITSGPLSRSAARFVYGCRSASISRVARLLSGAMFALRMNIAAVNARYFPLMGSTMRERKLLVGPLNHLRGYLTSARPRTDAVGRRSAPQDFRQE